jgi:dTDP-4-dehydrorhamnose reductase
VLNAAAWTDVDGAEADEAGAYAINGEAAGSLAAACARHGARLVHVSTDYVFDGSATTPYREDDPTGPRSAYGRTKLAGEQRVLSEAPDAFVVRTAWLYGAAGRSFVGTMLDRAARAQPVDVVDDQTGSPTWARDLAGGLIALARSTAPAGIHHLTNAGSTTWYGLAKAVYRAAGADPELVRPTTTDRFPRPAPRPAYSVLANDRWVAAGLAPLRHWEHAVVEYVTGSTR